MKPPTFVECSVCGREFGSKSIVIHERQCLQKLRRTEITPEQSNSTTKGTRRKKKTTTSSKSEHSTLTTATIAENIPHSSKQITLPKIQTESTSRSTDSQNKKGIIRPTTATLAKPKFLNLDHIQYDMSLTRIDYKTSTLRIMGEEEQGHRPGDELILPSVTSAAGNDKQQAKKINKEAPTNSNAKLPQSTIATISSFFGTPLKKTSNGDGNEISLPRQSASVYSLAVSHDPLLHPSSSTGFPVLCSHTELKRVKATHSTSLLDDGILPQISNDRSPPDEPNLDTLLTSAQNFINLPSHFQDERGGRKASGHSQSPLPSAQGTNNGDRLQHSSSWETHGTAQETCEEQVGHFDQNLSETSQKLVVLKEPVSCFDFESNASTSTTEFVMEEHSVLIENTSRRFSQQVLEMCISSDSEVNSVAPNLPKDEVDVSRTSSTASQNFESSVEDHNAWILHGSKDEERDSNLGRRSILKKRSSEDKSSQEPIPAYFRDRGRFNSFTGSDCDDEDESGQYGFLRQVSSLTLIKKSDSKKQGRLKTERKKNFRNQHSSKRNLRIVADQPPVQKPTTCDDEDQLMNQLTSLLHHKLAEPKKRKCRFPRPDSVQDKVKDWLASCESQPGADPVSIWEGHGNTAPSQTSRDRPSSSPAAIHYVDEDECGYDTDISRTSTDPSMGDVNEGAKKKVISGLLSAVFRIKEMHKTRTYQFRDQMTVNDTETDSGTQDTVHVRRTRPNLLETLHEPLKPVPISSKTFSHKMTFQKLDSKTLKALETIERNAVKATARSKPARPQTAPCLSTKRSQTKEQLPVNIRSKLISTSSGYCPPAIISRPVTSPTQTPSRPESPVPGVTKRPITSPSLNLEPLKSSQKLTSRPDSPNIRTSQVPKNPVKPKPKRPLTPRPVMKTGIKLPSQNFGKLFTKSTANQSSQIPEKRSKLVQSSPTLERKLSWKTSNEIHMSQPQSPAKVNRPRSPYEPPRSILKQLPKSKLVQFLLNQETEKYSKNKELNPTKRKTLKQKPEMETNKEESFLKFLTEPSQKFNAAEYTNRGDYSTTHQIYQFETETKFGEPSPTSNSIGNSGGQSHPNRMTTNNRMRHTSSSDSEAEYSSSELDNSVLPPPGKIETGESLGISPSEQMRQNDTSYWERMAQVDDHQNAIRMKQLDKQERAKGFSVERKSRFKSTYSLLVPKAVSGDRLMDLNIIVRRRDEFSDYPAIEEVIPEFSTDWMYLIVDEVKLTARSPNPYIESQAEHRNNGEYPLKITTSSHSTLDSNLDSEEENARLLLTCYICGYELNSIEFRRHETDCRGKFLERNQLLEPDPQEHLPMKPQGTIKLSAWNRFAQQCTKGKRITCPFCDVSFVPTEANVVEHKTFCRPLPRLTIKIEPLLDNFGNEIKPPCSPFVDLKLESNMPSRDVEGSVAEQFRKRFNKKRLPKENKSTVIESHQDDESHHRTSDARHKKIVVFVEKERE